LALNYDITSRDWDNTDVNVNITDPDGFNGIIDLDNDNASFSEGTLTDVVATADGLELKNDYALNFESTSGNYVDLPPSAIPSGNELTAEFLIYGGDALPKQTCLIEARSGTETTLRTINIHLPWSTGDVYFDCGNDGTGYDRIQKTATASEYKGSWHHWAFTKNANTGEMKIYLDGNLWYSETGKTLSIPVTASTVALGADFEGLTNFWDGKIKEVRLWEVERTQNQIQTNMNNELQGDETGLVAYYKIKEGEGNTLTDSAGTNDGTINGATWTVDTTRYLTTGTRQSPQLDLSPISTVESSSISWQETLNSQTITIETSVDGGSTWQTATNGGAIPNLPSDPTTLDVRQVLSTTDTTVTPVLDSLEVDIDTAVVNEDTGNITGSETQRFTLSFNDTGTLGSVEDNSPLMVSQQDSGYFNADAENFYTMVFEAVDEGKLISDIEYNQEGWITNPKNTSQWTKVDENKENLWTKVEKNTADWKKVGGE